MFSSKLEETTVQFIDRKMFFRVFFEGGTDKCTSTISQLGAELC